MPPITFKPVPNFKRGRSGMTPTMIVIHIGEGSQAIIYDTFLHEQKSAHYCVSKQGAIWQFVREEDTAWGNGIVVRPTAQQVLAHPNQNPNLYSISIEHEGLSTEDPPTVQLTATILLLYDICTRWKIPIDRAHIVAHHEIEASKTCPGKIDVDYLVASVRNLHDKQPPPASHPLAPVQQSQQSEVGAVAVVQRVISIATQILRKIWMVKTKHS